MSAPPTSSTPSPETGAHPEPDDGLTGHLVTSPEPRPPLISVDAAARTLCDYFLVNADRGDHAANDELVAELLGRMRTRHAYGVGTTDSPNGWDLSDQSSR